MSLTFIQYLLENTEYTTPAVEKVNADLERVGAEHQ